MDFSGPSSASQYFRIYFISPVVLFKVAKPCLAPTMISLLEPWILAVTLHLVRAHRKEIIIFDNKGKRLTPQHLWS